MATITLMISFIFIFSMFFIFSPSCILRLTKATSIDGFAVRLIHRDSPLSPFYDPKMTPYDRIISAFNRSMSRLNYLNSLAHSQSLVTTDDFSSRLVTIPGEFVMMFNVGTPPALVYAVADTGSGLIWLKCRQCNQCNDMDSNLPIFDPFNSSSFETLNCNSYLCHDVHELACPGSSPCRFFVRYSDNNFARGTVALDKFTFENPDRSSVDVGDIVFGCANNTSDSFIDKQLGVVGLNRRGSSLVSQLGITKFSYCMVVPDNKGSGSRMYFGSRAVISGGQTPLANQNSRYYYLTLQGISVGEAKVPIPEGYFDVDKNGGGGFIIDSGTTVTTLKSEAFDALTKVLKKAIRLPVARSPNQVFELCFRGNYDDLDPQPDITFHFLNADVLLIKQSTYYQVGQDLWCLGMKSTTKGISTFGNYQQQNYWVGYDLQSGMISFAPVECATF